MPIAVVCDPHGNVDQEYADRLNILRTFRHSPHTDRKEAHQIVFPLPGQPDPEPPGNSSGVPQRCRFF